MMNDQKETKDLVQKLVDQCPPHRPPSRPDRDEARRTVEDLLGRILNALGLPAERERPPSRAPTPESEGSSAEKLADEVLAGKWRQLNRSPIVEPQPLRPSSELNLEDWESYLDSEEQGVPPPTLIDLPPPVSFVQVPTAATTRARSVSPASTIEETVAGEPQRPSRRPSPEREREEREREEREWEEGTSSSGPPRHSLRTPRVGESDPGLDFLNLVKDHRRARRGGDGTFIPGDQAVSKAFACHMCPISYSFMDFLDQSRQHVFQRLLQTLGPSVRDQALGPGTANLRRSRCRQGPQLPYVLLLTDQNPFLCSFSSGGTAG